MQTPEDYLKQFKTDNEAGIISYDSIIKLMSGYYDILKKDIQRDSIPQNLFIEVLKCIQDIAIEQGTREMSGIIWAKQMVERIEPIKEKFMTKN